MKRDAIAVSWLRVSRKDVDFVAGYGGSGVGNLGAVEAEEKPWHGRPASAILQLPPSGVLWLAPDDSVEE